MRLVTVLIQMYVLTLSVLALNPVMVKSEPETMARLTRPKDVNVPDNLKDYLEIVKEYYNLGGKARYEYFMILIT